MNHPKRHCFTLPLHFKPSKFPFQNSSTFSRLPIFLSPAPFLFLISISLKIFTSQSNKYLTHSHLLSKNPHSPFLNSKMNTTTSFHDLPPHKRLRILQQQQQNQKQPIPCSPLPTKKRKESRNASFQDSPNNNPPSPPPPPPSLFSLPTKKRIRAFQPPNDVVPPFDLNIEYNPSPEKQPQQTPSNDENENDSDDGILCCVCQSTDANAEDPIVFCDGCDLMVHASCYGNPLSKKIPDGDWFCQRCRFKSETENDVVCSLCPNKEGAMKQTTEEGKWAHLVCALLVPEVFFLDPEGREGIDFSRVPKKRWLQKCYVCDCDGDGCALVCAEQKCELGFHITCGIKEDLCIEYKEGKKGSTVVAGFCKTHTQLWEKQQLSGKYKIVAVDDKKQQK